MRFPRSPDRGPIEARKAPLMPRPASFHFRDHQIAAPLKLFLLQNQSSSLPYFRDHQIAAPLKLTELRHCASGERAFPRSPDRGPIEASKALRLAIGWVHFRDHQIAAPLKQILALAEIEYRTPISAITRSRPH